MQNCTLRSKHIGVFLLVLVAGLFVALFAVVGLSLNPAQAQTTSSLESDLEVQVDSVMSMSLTNCDATNNSVVKLDVTPSSAGTFKSNCQTVEIDTNSPGYSLSAKASNASLQYLNPTTIAPTPTIPSTTNTIASPNTITNETWGFAVEGNGSFDASYTVDNASNKYAQLPTTDTTLYHTTTFPLPQTEHEFYYATKLTPATMAGTYATTVTYTAVGEVVAEPIIYPRVMNGAIFQDTTYRESESCSALPIYNPTNPDPASTVVMTDNRNGQDYRVRRLQDGKCWMIDNLKLATPGTALTLTSNDTDLVEGTTFIIPANAITSATQRVANGRCDSTVISSSGTAGYMTCDGKTTVTGNDDSENYNFAAYVDPSNTVSCLNNTLTDGAATAYDPSSTTGCGYLYNWYTATAGSGNYGTPSLTDATASICPINWRLPSVGQGTVAATNEFAVLNGAMYDGGGASGANNASTRANWFPDGSFSGAFAGNWTSDFFYQGSQMFAFAATSSTQKTSPGALNFSSSTILFPGIGLTMNKPTGGSVRCVL